MKIYLQAIIVSLIVVATVVLGFATDAYAAKTVRVIPAYITEPCSYNGDEWVRAVDSQGYYAVISDTYPAEITFFARPGFKFVKDPRNPRYTVSQDRTQAFSVVYRCMI